MGKVLTEDTVLKCAATPEAPHGGTLSTSGVSRLTIDGQKVLTAANVLAATISGCLNDPNAGQVKCTGVSEDVTGKSTKLKVEGEFVLLDTLDGTITNGQPPGKITADSGVHRRQRAE